MFGALPYKTKQFFFVLIKLSIVVGAAYYIHDRLTNNNEMDFEVFIGFLSKNDLFSLKNSLFVLFLTVFNWFFEILKWKELVSTIKKITFYQAAKQSLSALTASLFTPNRIGEYGAKVVYFSNRFRKRVLLLNLMGNAFQMGITVVAGIVGLYLFVTTYSIEISMYRISRFGAMLLLVALFGVLGISQKKYKVKGFSIERIINFIKDIPWKKKGLILLYSIIRYATFSYQFYFLLNLLGAELTYPNAMVGITSMYLLSSIIPTIFILDIVVKGSVAVYVFGILGVNEITVLSVITLMWILNFVLPSVFGGFHVLNFNHYTSEDE